MLRDHVEVVGDEQDGHIFLGAQVGDNLVEELEAVLVDAGDGLIEEQEVGHRVEGEREQDALEFAARECAEAAAKQALRVDAREAREDARAQLPGGAEPDGAAAEAGHEEVFDGDGRADVEAQVLRHVADGRVAGVAALGVDVVEVARVRDFAEDGAHEGAFAGAVGADEGRELAAVHVEVDVLEDGEAAGADAEVFDFRAAELAAVSAGSGAMVQDSFKHKML